jgi:hypothetical protein
MKTILKLIFNFRAMFTICYDANYLDFKNDFLNLPKENFFQDGERKLTEKEKYYQRVIQFDLNYIHTN